MAAANILNQIGRVGMVVGAGAYILPLVIFDVDAGERAVMYDATRGILPKPYGEGTHFKVPYFQKEHIMSIRSEPKEIKTRTGTKDLQQVQINLRVLSRPREEQLPRIFNELGVNFNDRVLPSLTNEVLKATVANYDASELLSKRAQISREIREALQKRASTFGLELVDVAITHLVFGQDFARAIEAKQVAQQEAERQQWVVEKADREREAAVIRAEGEAEAAMIVNQALQDSGSGLIEVRRIDTAKEIASSLAHARGVTYLPSGGGNGGNMLLGLNTN